MPLVNDQAAATVGVEPIGATADDRARRVRLGAIAPHYVTTVSTALVSARNGGASPDATRRPVLGDSAVLAPPAVVRFAAGAAACYLPAQRATRVDPMTALRAD